MSEQPRIILLTHNVPQYHKYDMLSTVARACNFWKCHHLELPYDTTNPHAAEDFLQLVENTQKLNHEAIIVLQVRLHQSGDIDRFAEVFQYAVHLDYQQEEILFIERQRFLDEAIACSGIRKMVIPIDDKESPISLAYLVEESLGILGAKYIPQHTDDDSRVYTVTHSYSEDRGYPPYSALYYMSR